MWFQFLLGFFSIALGVVVRPYLLLFVSLSVTRLVALPLLVLSLSLSLSFYLDIGPFAIIILSL